MSKVGVCIGVVCSRAASLLERPVYGGDDGNTECAPCSTSAASQGSGWPREVAVP